MTNIVLSRKNITFNEYSAASDAKGNKTYFCYASIKSCQAQVAKIIESGNLPRTVEVTGKNKMQFKISTYQDNGFWFKTNIHEGKKHRLWVPYKDLSNLKTIAEKHRKNQ